MKTNEEVRIETKLKLWNTPGFFWFIEDLQNLKGAECNFMNEIHSLKRNYEARLEHLKWERKGGNFKQTKLNL